jgi:uncharacterized protein YecE (DUF72 family)
VTATPPSVTGLYVGTSGFSYPSWKPGFYPPDARPEEFLALYARRLPSVELNTTFYRLPAEEQFRRWAEATPDGFRFAVKATRGIAHGGRLEQLPTFGERVRALGDRLGPVRVKLHDDRPRDDGFLKFLLGSADPELRLALEAAHRSWDGVEPLLAEAGAVRVGALDPDVPFCYLRLREPPYDEAALAAWAGRIAPVLAAGKEVYCYFKHEDEPAAPRYAERLAKLVAAVVALR